MKVRLIKPGMSSPDEKNNQPLVEVPIIDTIRSWVRDFQSMKVNRALVDYKQIGNLRKR